MAKTSNRKFLKQHYIMNEIKLEKMVQKGRVPYWPPIKYEECQNKKKMLNNHDFKSEKWFQAILQHFDVHGYVKNWPILNRFFADFYFPKIRLVVEIDGSGHRKEQENPRDKILKRIKIRTLRIKAGDEKKALTVAQALSENPRARCKLKKMQRFGEGKARNQSFNYMQKFLGQNIKPMEMRPGYLIRRNGVEIKKVSL